MEKIPPGRLDQGMEGQELKPRLFSRRRAMALPLTLVFILVGAVLVGAALYVVENMHSTSRHVVTETQLYNAAQSGIEKAKMVLWENRNDLKTDPLMYSGNITAIYAQKSNSTPLGPIQFTIDPGISVEVLIFDCNYELSAGSFSDLSDEERKLLPPRFPGGTGERTVVSSVPPLGTSAIMDPGRFYGGGAGERRFVIRSSASKDGKDFEIESMVVVRK